MPGMRGFLASSLPGRTDERQKWANASTISTAGDVNGGEYSSGSGASLDAEAGDGLAQIAGQ